MYIALYILVAVLLAVACYIYVDRLSLVNRKFLILYTLINLIINFLAVLRFVVLQSTTFDMFTGLKMLCLLEIMFTAAFIDYHKHIIPNKLVLSCIGIRFVLAVFELVFLKEEALNVFAQSAFACIVPLILMILGVFIMHNSIGMGDIKILFAMALYMNFTYLFTTLFYSLIIALMVAVIFLIKKKKNSKDVMPFAPFLLVGTYVTVILHVL